MKTGTCGCFTCWWLNAVAHQHPETRACGRHSRGGGGKRCGGQQSFSACGGCCKVSTTKDAVVYAKAPQRARRGHAWRCFTSDKPNYPKLSKTRHHVVLVRDVLATHESILRRFWKWDARPGGGVDTLAREETALGKAMAKLEGHAFDCRRTLYLSFDHARRHPAACPASSPPPTRWTTACRRRR